MKKSIAIFALLLMGCGPTKPSQISGVGKLCYQVTYTDGSHEVFHKVASKWGLQLTKGCWDGLEKDKTGELFSICGVRKVEVIICNDTLN